MDKYWFLAIKHNGKMKNARRARPLRHKATHFLALKERTYKNNSQLMKILQKLQLKS